MNEQLFDTLIGKSLRRVCENIGFPEVPEEVFSKDMIAPFTEVMDKLPKSHYEARTKLVQELAKGQVIDLRTLSSGKTHLTVQFELYGYDCTVRLRHWKDQWDIVSSPKVVKLKQTFRFKTVPVAVIGGIVLCCVFGIWLMMSSAASSAVSLEQAMETVEENGYVVMTETEKTRLEAEAEQTGYEKAKAELASQQDEADDQNNADAVKADTEKKEVKKFVFTMKSGMTTEDLTTFLKDNGLIDDRLAFGKKLEQRNIATKINIGTYEFTSDMDEQELLNVLESKVAGAN